MVRVVVVAAAAAAGEVTTAVVVVVVEEAADTVTQALTLKLQTKTLTLTAL